MAPLWLSVNTVDDKQIRRDARGLMWDGFSRVLAWPLIGLVQLYRLTLSPWLGRACRFQPTCSVYALDALRRYGAFRGTWLAARRIGRCHPWGSSGYDPVPDDEHDDVDRN